LLSKKCDSKFYKFDSENAESVTDTRSNKISAHWGSHVCPQV